MPEHLRTCLALKKLYFMSRVGAHDVIIARLNQTRDQVTYTPHSLSEEAVARVVGTNNTEHSASIELPSVEVWLQPSAL